MYEKETTIRNETGLHARPASEFVKCALQYASRLTIQRTVGEPPKMNNAKSMVTLLTQGLACGELVQICGDGPDEQEAVDTLVALIDSGFGE